jgi:hypothetical protein
MVWYSPVQSQNNLIFFGEKSWHAKTTEGKTLGGEIGKLKSWHAKTTE